MNLDVRGITEMECAALCAVGQEMDQSTTTVSQSWRENDEDGFFK